MSKIKNAFKNEKAFIGFVTGGDPTIEECENYILELIDGGADMIEIGIPFSDPIAEGPTVQLANIRSLNNGCTTDKLFDMVKRLRTKTDIPMIFSTYLNPVFNYGYDNFFAACHNCGIDAIIVPDMPYEEKGEIFDIAAKNDVDIISIIVPISKKRVEMIAKDAVGFIYLPTAMSEKGFTSEEEDIVLKSIKLIRQNSNMPIVVGFDECNENFIKRIIKKVDGIISSSEIVKIIEKNADKSDEEIKKYTEKMKNIIK